jgi:hypothetical protein
MGRRTHDGLCDTRAFSITDGRDGDGPTGPGRTTELNSVRRPGRRSPRDRVRTAETKSFGAARRNGARKECIRGAGGVLKFSELIIGGMLRAGRGAPNDYYSGRCKSETFYARRRKGI